MVLAAVRTFCIVERSVTIVWLTFFCNSAKAPWNSPRMFCVRSASASAAMTRRTSLTVWSTLDTSSLTLDAKRLRSSFS
ncbi:hypothetical protein D9M70_650570 [compost metagenome]